MSEVDRNKIVTGSAEVEEQAAGWLWRYHSGAWRPEDQAELDEWLAQSHSHQAAFWRMKAVWQRSERLAALRSSLFSRAALLASKRIWTIAGRVAAVISGLVILGVAGASLWPAPRQTYATAVGGHATIRLADGSKVELNTNTVIAVHFTPHNRVVTLKKGEAFFRVTHNAARPFVVLAAGHRITDLGTEFDVRTAGDSLRVSLVKGRVRLETAGPWTAHRSTNLVPGETVVATQTSMSLAKLKPPQMADALAWQRGKLVFHHTTLADAAVQFNRYNTTQLVVAPDVANFKISGTFKTDSLDAFTKVATFAMGLHMTRKDGVIAISR